MSSYSDKDTKPAKKKRGRPKKVAPAPAPDPAPTPAPSQAPTKKGRTGAGAMSDAQKADLTKHMEKMKKGGMSPNELKSHRMKLMSRMRRGMSASKAHADVMGK